MNITSKLAIEELVFPINVTRKQYNRLHKTNKNALRHVLGAINRDTMNYNRKVKV